MKKIAVFLVVKDVIFLMLHDNQSVDYKAEYVMKNCAERGELPVDELTQFRII